MPVGSWLSETFSGSGGGQRGGGMGGSLTGPAAPSQPNTLSAPTPVAGQSIPGGSSTSTQTTLPYGQGRLNPNIGRWALDAVRTQASQPTSNALAQQAVGGNPLSGARSLLDAFYGPQSTLLDQTLARQGDRLGMVGINADYDRGALRRDAALDRQGLDLRRSDIGLDREALGVDRNLTAGQLGNLDRLRGILAKQFGLNREDLDARLNQLGIDENQLKDMAGRQKFDLRSNLTARGAFNTVANDRGTGRIDRDLLYGLAGIQTQRKQADINFRGTDLGLQEKGIGYDNQGLSLNARLQNIGIDNRRLDNALAKVGLDEQALGNALEDGLRNIGLAEYMDINGLLDAIGGTNVQQAELARTVLEQLIGYSNLPPDVLAALMEGMGVPAPGQRPASSYAGPSYRR